MESKQRRSLTLVLVAATFFLSLPLFRINVWGVLSTQAPATPQLSSIRLNVGHDAQPFEPTSRTNIPDWMHLHAEYVQEVKELVQVDPDLDVLFYGDSITEFARGTCMGHAHCQDEVHDVWRKVIGNNYKAHILAISGDQTPHLLWRLQNGELSTSLKPKVVVVLIGTNDLGNVARCKKKWHRWGGDGCNGVSANLTEVAERTAATIQSIAQEVLTQAPSAQLLLQAVLPRGYKGFQQPSLFTEPISIINSHLQRMAESSDILHYVDCGADFLSQDGSQIISSFMADALHPSAAGEVFMLQCLRSAIDPLLPYAPTQQSSSLAKAAPKGPSSATTGWGSGTSKAAPGTSSNPTKGEGEGGEGGNSAILPLVE